MIDIRLEESPGGWTARVRVEQDGARTEHDVTVSRADLERFGGGSPADLVRRSFEFLLRREPATSILRRFALGEIGRYFPEYEREMGRH